MFRGLVPRVLDLRVSRLELRESPMTAKMVLAASIVGLASGGFEAAHWRPEVFAGAVQLQQTLRMEDGRRKMEAVGGQSVWMGTCNGKRSATSLATFISFRRKIIFLALFMSGVRCIRKRGYLR